MGSSSIARRGSSVFRRGVYFVQSMLRFGRSRRNTTSKRGGDPILRATRLALAGTGTQNSQRSSCSSAKSSSCGSSETSTDQHTRSRGGLHSSSHLHQQHGVTGPNRSSNIGQKAISFARQASRSGRESVFARLSKQRSGPAPHLLVGAGVGGRGGDNKAHNYEPEHVEYVNKGEANYVSSRARNKVLDGENCKKSCSNLGKNGGGNIAGPRGRWQNPKLATGKMMLKTGRTLYRRYLRNWRDRLRYLEASTGNAVMRMLTTVTWCVIYICSTSLFLSRDGIDASWRVAHGQIPGLISELEGIILWIVTIEFLLSFLAADNKVSFLCHVNTLADVVCLGPIIIIICTFLDYGVTIDSYLLQLGWLRFMRFYGAETLLATLCPSCNQVRLQIFGLLLELVALVCTFAGGMYFFEA